MIATTPEVPQLGYNRTTEEKQAALSIIVLAANAFKEHIHPHT